MREKYGIDDNTWEAFYADTVESDNPVLTNEEKPERVSENVLRQSGLYKDYSRHIGK